MESNTMSQSPNNSPDKAPPSPPVDPDALMGRINGLSFFAVLVVSLIIHTTLIGATSVGHIQNCLKYWTIHPELIIRQAEKEKRAEERAKKRTERQQKEADQVAERKASDKKNGKTTSKPKSKIEEKINQKSTTLPAKSGVSLDDIDEL